MQQLLYNKNKNSKIKIASFLLDNCLATPKQKKEKRNAKVVEEKTA